MADKNIRSSIQSSRGSRSDLPLPQNNTKDNEVKFSETAALFASRLHEDDDKPQSNNEDKP